MTIKVIQFPVHLPCPVFVIIGDPWMFAFFIKIEDCRDECVQTLVAWWFLMWWPKNDCFQLLHILPFVIRQLSTSIPVEHVGTHEYHQLLPPIPRAQPVINLMSSELAQHKLLATPGLIAWKHHGNTFNCSCVYLLNAYNIFHLATLIAWN